MTAGSGSLALVADHQSFDDCSAFGSALARNRFSWNLDAAVNDQYRASLKVGELGATVLADVIFDPIEGCRRPADCADDDRHRIILTLYERGSASFICGSDEVVMHADEMLLLDGSRNCSTLTSETVHCKTILFPRGLAQQHVGHLHELNLQRVGASDSTSLLLRSHIRALYDSMHLIAPRDRSSVLGATLDLIGICFRSGPRNGTQYTRLLFERIESFMIEQALEPNLNPTSVAQHFEISTRHLHRLFAEAGTTFSAWLRTERLKRAKNALANESFAGASITQIAHLFGFYDAAHFSNLFKAKFGLSPREYREGAIRGHLN